MGIPIPGKMIFVLKWGLVHLYKNSDLPQKVSQLPLVLTSTAPTARTTRHLVVITHQNILFGVNSFRTTDAIDHVMCFHTLVSSFSQPVMLKWI